MRKMQFILNEIINDMGIKKSDFWEWLSTVLLATFVFWLRMLIHYVGQWIFLKAVSAPVTEIDLKWYEIRMDYAYWKMEQQLGVVVIGPLANTILFCFFIGIN